MTVDAADTSLFDSLRTIDTPTITNVVATYPRNPLCLGLYNPWTEPWYTDASIRCLYPDLGPVIGYAVTIVFGLPDPNFSGRLGYRDLYEALEASPRPTILVAQQKWPPELASRVGLFGELTATAMQRLGCVGVLSNGPSRDIDAVRRLGFQMLLGGVTAGHGDIAIHAVNVPVSVGGMHVAPGELVHMDESGAVKFPSAKAEAVLTNARAMLAEEKDQLEKLRVASTASEVWDTFASRGNYGRK